MTSNGLETPPVQNESQIRSTLLLISPVINAVLRCVLLLALLLNFRDSNGRFRRRVQVSALLTSERGSLHCSPWEGRFERPNCISRPARPKAGKRWCLAPVSSVPQVRLDGWLNHDRTDSIAYNEIQRRAPRGISAGATQRAGKTGRLHGGDHEQNRN